MSHGVRITPDPSITQEYLLGVFSYDPDTGDLTRLETGNIVGGRSGGHRGQVDVLGVKYTKTHVIWMMVRGEWPEAEIDHDDQDCTNDRWTNLRPATRSLNNINRRKQNRRSTSKYQGVKLRRGRWQAFSKTRSGDYATLGYFDTEEAAARARDARVLEEFGAFANLNFPRENHAS